MPVNFAQQISSTVQWSETGVLQNFRHIPRPSNLEFILALNSAFFNMSYKLASMHRLLAMRSLVQNLQSSVPKPLEQLAPTIRPADPKFPRGGESIGCQAEYYPIWSIWSSCRSSNRRLRRSFSKLTPHFTYAGNPCGGTASAIADGLGMIDISTVLNGDRALAVALYIVCKIRFSILWRLRSNLKNSTNVWEMTNYSKPQYILLILVAGPSVFK